ncbi:RES family NAD+ phosphorylase [Alteromonas sp. 14N.309.X.WAT.G.H12]|uniref:RES family NAD+ phosphorylase n=1 Tax=Alteromonas sp. 14N.309.X.WAT.G.H12 TaxID=3120824 RepID=UPI002FD3E78B
MKLYRVTNQKFANIFNGKGASYEYGARWNSAGYPVIYFALDIGTAMIESANYNPSYRLIPPSHCKAIYSVDDKVTIKRLPAKTLPADWDKMPYSSTTQKIGDEFLSAQNSLFLLVPSVGAGLDDESKIAIANPNHPEIKKIRLIRKIRPVYSDSMFSGLN